jgi:hypothetical protein
MISPSQASPQILHGSFPTPVEVRHLVNSLKATSAADGDVSAVGTPAWVESNYILLSQISAAARSQAVVGDEYLKDELIRSICSVTSLNKVQLLVYELILFEVILNKIRQSIQYGEIRDSTIYQLIEFYELNLINLIQTISFHSDVIEAMGDLALDLEDYCYRKVRSPIHFLRPLSCPAAVNYQLLAWSSGYDDCLTRSRSRVQFSMPTLFLFRLLQSSITRIKQIWDLKFQFVV